MASLRGLRLSGAVPVCFLAIPKFQALDQGLMDVAP